MPRWELVTIKADSTGGTQGDVGPTPTYASAGSFWAVVTLLTGEMKEAGIRGGGNKVDLSESVYRVRFRDTPTIKMAGYQIVLTDRSSQILTPIQPAVNPDGYGRDTTVIAKDTRKVAT